ncbi:hypothetical protein PV10_05621 [Exophiala mesophila]|uniref:TIGR00730 family protein n=1 Tax=Exophiala mesophila TaxID=212818 RepID=A0A0D1ZAQ3_EXOME|nr:uncharacterized protein PV10_05621 [Exophiala mesophila]KIV91034.1 hypothetical protein PV10_05621 [Exophiala mesophila]
MAASHKETMSNGKQPVVCVFCGSSAGKNPAHLESAQTLGTTIGKAGYKLVYGGGTMGVMGEVAKSVVSVAGPDAVEGIIPRALIQSEKDVSMRSETSRASAKKPERTMSEEDLERIDSNTDPDVYIVPKSEFGSTTIVPDMHTRKRMMAQRVEQGGAGSGFIALAGGYGTMEEVMEMVTWNQLGIHSIPVVLVNINGYWNGLLELVRNSVREGFISPGQANILVEVKSTDDVLAALRDYQVAPGRYKLDWETIKV